MHNFFKKLLQKTVTKKVIFFVLMDIAILIVAMFGAFLLRFDGVVPLDYGNRLWSFIAISLVIYILVFAWQGLYGLSWSYISVAELIRIFRAVTFGALFFGTLLFLARGQNVFFNFPRSIILINYFLVLVLVLALRSTKRVYYEITKKQRLVDHTRAEDLIRRDPVDLDKKLIGEFLTNKKVLVTGAAGSIGQSLVKEILSFRPSELILIDQDETGIFNLSQSLLSVVANQKMIVADITDKNKIEIIFKRYRPQIVFHAAAYKHVPVMEDNCSEAVKNNVFGTLVLSRLALKYGVKKFIFISTDKAVNPCSVMGATKQIAEMILHYLNRRQLTKFIAVRFGNVLGSRGSVVPIFQEAIRQGGPIKITHPDMERYFMMVDEACQLVIQAAAFGRGGEVFVLDMGRPVKIVDLAKRLIALSGLRPGKDIKIIFTDLRPGEKIIEEVLTEQEGARATKYQKIYCTQLVVSFSEADFFAKLNDLCQTAHQCIDAKTKIILYNMVNRREV